jgi:hypothetical protein
MDCRQGHLKGHGVLILEAAQEATIVTQCREQVLFVGE